MSRIPPVDPTTAEGKPRELFAGIQKALGTVPNLYRVIGRSPVALEGALALAGALARGRLRPRLREQIALAVAQQNGCDYCLSAHTALGKGLQVSDADLALAREGRATDPQDDAALRFVVRVVERRGRVDDEDLEAVRRAGFDDGQVVELVANTVLNVFTNYLNQVADTEIDFPVVRAAPAKAA
ncbi:carboxymuconolactone decarboxylase family protein [Anaeromyxobacter sp. PSR-1]|uniref:carboxymuconolactone decarboxylase family protein n=1 Tax=unclassified Anaeromyxobacter TaxID=2620896 RepID=UPI0005E2CDA1|nr:carboxymuconolactone decarboxylase family protein [Anaeromyxobacter sp. PSR-1]GAO01740.1 carboxymuconolactone decarboxylase family protein [Anaeromyxobacter sp. PSR-1]